MSDNALVDIVRELLGEDAAKIISILLEKEETSDDELIQKTGMKINNLRRILYQLFDKNFVLYRREKDREIGWYKYYWRINPTGINILINSIRKKVLAKLKDRLNYEMNNMFFACPDHQKNRYTFEEAMELNFQCPHCGKRLDNIRNDEIVTILKIKISEIEKRLKMQNL
ncbi:MAG: transcription factor [Candidatus Verstraetearchaeota archaeon]|jgi:transcription initiation factor TFIIE subunit alpha|nr:transcription factor [Candidatus Verstraetearchaeota archaeon]